MSDAPQATSERYPMAPLIRFTLIALYLALAAPLPVLAPPSLVPLLWIALVLGLLLVVAATSEQVELSAEGIRVGHPAWCRWLLRRGWQLSWPAIDGITPVTTSQGGRVHYLRQGERAYLLPQRIAGLEPFLARLGRETGLSTAAIGRISPPWTYRLLALLCGVMLTAEAAIGSGLIRLPASPIG
ncbi:MAG: hypothetical protein VKI63_03660 [Cyanobium sp.]|nr:hypothetical protein [Cyanobium sp.]